ncbi:MAG: Gfo/Idh/MocA family oxidoreductase [Chitinophagaceae bacterium]
MGKPVRFAIIGCGKIAARHSEQAAKHGQVVAVCDIIAEKANAFAATYNAHPYLSLDDLLVHEKDIDLVAVCTPNWLHAQHSIQSLSAGCNVLCEKPLAISTQDATSMINSAEKAGKKLFVVKSTRYNPALINLKKLLDEQKLGTLYSFQLNCFWNRPPAYYSGTWRGKLNSDGGTLYTQFSHYIDAMLWLFGEVRSIKGFRKNQSHQSVIEFEDSGIAALEMENGMIGGLNWSVNTFKKNMEVSLTVIAEKGSIRIAGEYMNKTEYDLADGFSLDTGDIGNANDYGFYKGSMSNHDKVYENLVMALKDDQYPFTNATEGLKTVETIEKIYNCVPLS